MERHFIRITERQRHNCKNIAAPQSVSSKNEWKSQLTTATKQGKSIEPYMLEQYVRAPLDQCQQ